MARTRQKAKQRQAKRREQELREAQGTTGQKPPSNPLEQAVVDEARAEEIADVLEEADGDVAEAEERLEAEPSDELITPVEEEEPEPVEAPEPVKAPARTKTRERRERKPQPQRQRRAERKREPRQRGRVINFLIQVWAELRRVQWPDRTQVTQATGVVIVFCLIAGLYLAFFDRIFSELVKRLL
jgi:preprotein translocase SecE subunit